MTKTINLDAPLLGLGDDYEPFDLGDDDLLWGCVKGTTGDPINPRKPLRRFPSRSDVSIAHPHATPTTQTLRDAKRQAATQGRPSVNLCDGDMNIIRTWPV